MAATKSSTMRGSTAAAVAMLAIAGAAACTTAGSVLAQSYPSRPVRVIVPFPPGSAPDQIMRFVTQHMAQASGQPFIMDNRPGANGNIGVEVAARATPDGYTLVSANNTTFAGNVSLYRKLPFDIQKDFTPVARFITTGLILAVRNDLPAKDLREFIMLAKARQGKLTAGQASAGMRVSIGMMRSLGGAELLEVSYKGTPQAVTDVIGGQIDSTFSDFSAGLQLVRAGKMRALGVTSLKRSAGGPDIPAIAEGLVGFEMPSWFGLLAPAGTPRPIIDRLHQAMVRVLAIPELRELLVAQGADPVANTPDQFGEQIREELKLWAQFIKQTGIKPE